MTPILFGFLIYMEIMLKKYRESQWHHIINSEHAGFFQNKPRMMIGDFNDVKYTTEKQGGIKRSVS